MMRHRMPLGVALWLAVAAAGLMWLGTHPEPCTDHTTTVCAGPRSAP